MKKLRTIVEENVVSKENLIREVEYTSKTRYEFWFMLDKKEY